MKKNFFAWLIGFLAILILLVMTSVTKSPVSPAASAGSSEQVNLALREIADHLLRQNNDFTTLIPPVRQEGAGTYIITLNSEVDYPGLRSAVDQILQRHHIRPDYRLSLLNCESGQVELGFLAYTSDENKEEVPCREREQNTACYNVRLTLLDANSVLAEQAPTNTFHRLQWLMLGLAVSFPFMWLFWKRQPSGLEEAVVKDGWLSISAATQFHPDNQLLKVNEQTLELTFREAKLLRYFYEHQNQVLERERILESVWEDEGVIVGRSLDVFVSRLRKKLKADKSVQIANVHGVGYRLMI